MSKKYPDFTLNNGITMPAFGLGVFQSCPEDTVFAVKTAIESGYRLIDTAAAYSNEQQVGESISASPDPDARILLRRLPLSRANIL